MGPQKPAQRAAERSAELSRGEIRTASIIRRRRHRRSSWDPGLPLVVLAPGHESFLRTGGACSPVREWNFGRLCSSLGRRGHSGHAAPPWDSS